MTDADAAIPADTPPDDPAPTGRRTAPDEVWARVRQDYLDGLSAPVCCQRHGVGLTALRQRAAAEGWRRVDQPWTPPEDLRAPDDPGVEIERTVDGYLEDIGLGQLSWVAEHRTMLAILRGDSREALRWRRVRVELDLDEAECFRRRAHEDNIAEERARILADREERRATETTDAVDPDASDGVFSPPPFGPAAGS